MSERPEQTAICTAMSRLTRQQNEVMLKLFRTAYCVVKHNFSLRSFPALIDLQECNGLNLGRAYRNRMAASSFMSSIANVTQSAIIQSINSRKYFSLLIDGSTDVSTVEQEIVYCHYLEDGMPLTIFLGLMSVKSGTASQIVNDLDAFLTNFGITDWKNKIIGFGSDGASVNVGSEAGVATLKIFLTLFQYIVWHTSSNLPLWMPVKM